MARTRTLERVILVVLVAGAIVFGLLLAGVGSGILTKPHASAPSPSIHVASSPAA
jgi:hypothetical protein